MTARLRILGLPPVFAAAVATLPFTDWPYMPGPVSYVRPLAVFPVAVGCGVMAARLLVPPPGPGPRLPVSVPFCLFLVFALWAVLASPMTMLLDPGLDSVKGRTPPGRYGREVLGLLTGLGAYAYFTVVLRHWRRGEAAVRVMFLVFPLVLGAVLIQAGWLFFGIDFLHRVDGAVLGLVQAHPAIHKASGLSPEGSMLADQLTTTIVPFALAGLTVRHSLFRQRPLGFPVELWVLVGAVAAIAFTTSRIGFLVLALTFVLAFVLHRVQRPALRRRQRVLLALLPLALAAALLLHPTVRERAVAIAGSLRGVEISVSAGVWSNVTRMGTQATAYRMLLAHPLGVGTGGFPFHFADYVPGWALASPEIQVFLGMRGGLTHLVCTSDCAGLLPDAKGYLARIGAENGWIGLALVTALYLGLVARAWRSYRSATDPALTHLALGCLLSLGAMALLSFGQSSYLWLHWYLVWALAGSLPAAPARRPAARPPIRLPATP